MDEEYLKALFEETEKDYDLGGYENFKNLLSNDRKFREAFFSDAGEKLSLGKDINEFETTLGLKKNGSSIYSEGPRFRSEYLPSDTKSASILNAKPKIPTIQEATTKAAAKLNTGVQDAIIPEPEKLDLPKKSRADMYTYALNRNIDLYKKAEQEYSQYEALEQMVKDLASGDLLVDEAQKAQIIADYNAALPKINEIKDRAQQAYDKAVYFDQALQGNRKLRALNTDSDFKARFIDVGLNQLGSLAGNAIAGTARVYANTVSPHERASLEQIQQLAQKSADEQQTRGEFMSRLMDERDNYANKEISDIYNQAGGGYKGLNAATEYAAKKFTESLPITLGIMGASLTGAGGAAIANTALFGGTANQKYESLKDRTDMSEEAKITNALGTGTAELLFEGVLTSGMGSVYKQMIKTMGKEAAAKEIKKNIIDLLSNSIKKTMPLSGAVIEGLGEGATQFTQNFIDKETDPTKKDINLMDGVVDAMAIGTVGGAGLSSPATVAQGVGYLNRSETIKKNEDLMQKREAIKKDLNTDISESTKDILLKKDAELLEKQNELAIEDRNILTNKMSDSDRETVKELYNQRDAILQSINEVEDPVTKESLQENYDAISKEIDNIYTKAETNDIQQPDNITTTDAGSEQIEPVTEQTAIGDAEGTGITPESGDTGIPVAESESTTSNDIAGTEPATTNLESTSAEDLKEKLVKSGKIVLDKSGKVQDVKQNSGASSHFFQDLVAISGTGDKEEALKKYLKYKNDKGSFKMNFADWENKIMRDYGRSGYEYDIRTVKSDDKNNPPPTPDTYAWSGEQNGKPVIYFNGDLLGRNVPFKDQKSGYIKSVIDPEIEAYKEQGNEKAVSKMEEYKRLFEEKVNSNRDLKLHLIHNEMYGIMNSGKEITVDDIDRNYIISVNEVDRLNTVNLAKDYFGEPMIFTTGAPEEITKFRKPGSEGYKRNDPFTGQEGIYFSRDIRNQEKYGGFEKGNKPGPGKDLYYVFLRYKNAYHLDDPQAQAKYPISDIQNISTEQRKALEKLGYDAIIKSSVDRPKEEVVVFEPDQIEIIGTYKNGLNVENTEKSDNFESNPQNNENKAESIQSTKESSSAEGSSRNAEASDVARRIRGTGEESSQLSDQEIKSKEESALQKYAKENGIWYDSAIETFGEPQAEGTESLVYLDADGKTVFKINTGRYYKTWADFFDAIEINNQLFPETKYEVIGFTTARGKFSVIVKQPLITAERGATREEVKADMEKRGFSQIEFDDYQIKENGLIIKDLHGQNVLVSKEGNLFYIDPAIYIDPESKYLKTSKNDQNLEKGELSEAEKANLENISAETNVNFREIQNVYTKYGEGKPLSEITIEDYQEAQKKREDSKEPPEGPEDNSASKESDGKKSGRTKSYEESRVPVSKEYRDIVNDNKVYYKELNIADNAQSAIQYLESFGTDKDGLEKAYEDLINVFLTNPYSSPINGVAAELLSDRLFHEANNAYLNGDNKEFERLTEQSNKMREAAFKAATVAGQYNAALGILTRSSNPDAFLLFVNREVENEIQGPNAKAKKEKVSRKSKELEKELDKVKKEVLDEVADTVKEPANKKPKKRSNLQNLKERGQKRQKDALDKLKKLGYLGSSGLNNESIEAIGELILAQIELGIYKAATIAKKISALTNGKVNSDHIKDVYDQYKFDVDGKEYTLKEYSNKLFNEESAEVKEKEISKRIDDLLKDENRKELTLSQLVRRNLEIGATVESLTDAIVAEFGLGQQEAQRLSERVYQTYKRKLSEKIDKVLSRELGIKPLKKINEQETSGPYKPEDKTLGSKIVNQILAGALDNKTLSDAFSVKYGLPVITSTVANNIRLLALNAKNATTTTSRMRANKILMQYIHQNMPIKFWSVLNSAYYISLLSGPSTAVVNTLGNINALINQRFENGITSIIEAAQGNKANLINPLSSDKIKYAISNINQGIIQALDILQNGGGESKYYNLNQKGLNNFDAERLVAKKSDFKNLDLAKALKTAAKLWYTIPTLVNRNLDASDVMFDHLNFNMEAVREVRKDLYKQGLRGKDLETATFETVYGTKEIQQQAIKDAQVEAAKIGIDPAKEKKFVKRIAYELIQQRLSDEIQRVSNIQAKENIYKGAPRGFTGYLASKIPTIALITPFVSTVMKIAERNMNYIPIYGIARYAGYSVTDLARKSDSIDKAFTDKGIENVKREGELRNKQLAQVLASHALLFGLYALSKVGFDDDDDPKTPDIPLIDISGGYVGMSYKDRQDAINDMPEYIIRIGNYSMNYEQNPLLAMVALPLSVPMDYERAGKDKTNMDFLLAYAKALPLFLMNQTPLQNFSEFFKSTRDYADPSSEIAPEQYAANLLKFVIKPVSNIVAPNTYQQTADYINPTKYNATDLNEVLWKSFNMEKIGGLHPTYDVWGRTVEFYPGERRLPLHYWMKNAGDDEIDAWASKNDISIPSINLKQLVLDLETSKSHTLKDWEQKQKDKEMDDMSDVGDEIEDTLNYKVLSSKEWQDMDQTIRFEVYNVVKNNFHKVKNDEKDASGRQIISKPFSQMTKKEADERIEYFFRQKRLEYINEHYPVSEE